ncbi:GNAT family N-acetyltransferase [Desulfosporosinus sp. FKA]|uniref:GNAT family N-acetyltransferase n=1 Tax=Desulfosporosinus sp. FKA TaxID=1969834 RepID=UPI000B49F927|nr:GNAT family N-acetyltransferase [Desulfosporosinus sp. FKA]
MIIREMVADDISDLAKLYTQFWSEESCVKTMHKQFVKFQKNNSHILLSAIENNELIGSVMGVICEELYGDCKPFLVLENMIVDKEYRNQGVGKALISELEEIAATRNCSQVILVTESNRIDACKFYESAGYSPRTHNGYKKKLK